MARMVFTKFVKQIVITLTFISNTHLALSESSSISLNIPSLIKKRITKIYNCLIGSDTCSPDEVIFARMLFIIASIEIYRKVHAPLWWIERQRQHVIKNKANPIPLDQKDKHCFVCYDESSFDDVPCAGGNHPAQICTKCLQHLKELRAPCPLCRKALI